MSRTKHKMTIGTLAQEAEVGVETIRFYERKGLVPKPTKLTGFREYHPENISRIKFIKRAQELGFTLKEVAELLGLQSTTRATCAAVKTRTDQKLVEIVEKLKDLKRMQKKLKEISSCCANRKVTTQVCLITDCFEGRC